MNITEKCNQLLSQWIGQEDGQGIYKMTGAYWEVLLPILEKHSPDKLQAYANMLGEDFDIRNDRVQRIVDQLNEEKNYRNAILYFNNRQDSYATPADPHYLDFGDDNIVSYIPNEAMQEQPEFDG